MVTVAVNSSEFIGQFKSRPVQSLDERLAMVKAIRWVNQVQINDGADQPALIMAADTDVILVGDDWKDRDYHEQLQVTQQWLDRKNIVIRYLPRLGGYSSSSLKAAVSARRLG